MPRFVILEHHWNGVHWDLMLDVGDSLRTWALEAIPSADDAGGGVRARALGDHRRAYLDYEGEVSGDRGFVRRWDTGHYEALAWEEDYVAVRLAGGQLVGRLELRRAVERGGDEAGGAVFWLVCLRKAD